MTRPLFTPAVLALLLWAAFVGSLLAGHSFRLYVAAWQAPLLWAVLLVLLLLAAFELWPARAAAASSGGGQRAGGLAAVWDTAVHGLPLFLLLSVGVGELQASPLDSASSPQASAAIARARERNTAPGKAAETAQQKAGQLSLLDLYAAPAGLAGRELELRGRLYLTEGRSLEWLSKDLQPGAVHALLYRYLITCCVADAVPLTAVLDGPIPEDLPQQSWVTVRGRLRTDQREGEVPVLELLSIHAASPPEQPYLTLYSPLLGSDSAGTGNGSSNGPPGPTDELLLNPCNPCDDPAKDFNWPQGDSAN